MHRIVLALILLVPAAHAGTADNPEITDATGDTFVWPNAPGVGPLADAMDLTAVWVTYEDDTVSFHMEVVDLTAVAATRNNPVGDHRWWVEFQPLETSNQTLHTDPWEVRLFLSQGSVYATSFTLANADGIRTDVSGEMDMEANQIRIDVPIEMLGIGPGGVIADLYARTGTYMPAYPIWTGDDGTHETGAFTIPGGVEQGSAQESAAGGSIEAPASVADESSKESSDESAPLADDVEAPGAPLMFLLAGLGLIGFLRRQSL